MARKLVYGTPKPGELTAKKWREKGYLPKKNAHGVERWFGWGTHICYTESDVTYVGDEVIAELLRKRRREIQWRYRENRKEREKEEARLEEVAENYHTAHQWLTEYGRIPLRGAEWYPGEPEAGQSNQYVYCHISHTREPHSDAELQEIISREHEAYMSGECRYYGHMLTKAPKE